jgi:hypothetical protein
VAYLASAEVGFYSEVGWSPPTRIVDLYVEYRNRFNCLETVVEQKLDKKDENKIKRNSLIGALTQFDLPTIGTAYKEKMRDLIQTGGPWTPAQKLEIEDYCEDDVIALDRLLTAMLPQLDIPRALYRGRYMACNASVEGNGISIDGELLTRMRERWEPMQQELIARIDTNYGVYEGTSFRRDKFERYLIDHEIQWPRYPSGSLILTDKTFREMSRIHPEISSLRELRYTLSNFRLHDLTVGSDNRNRCMTGAFGSCTSRNTPSSSRYIFGPGVWIRGLIKPPPGCGKAYIDWHSAEIGAAAAYSGDLVMQAAYNSRDVYLEFAKMAKAVPPDATRETHQLERALYKLCMLGANYGMEEHSLAIRIGQPVLVARRSLQHHREIFWRFWEWSDNRVRRAMLTGVTYTPFGWTYHVSTDPNPRSVRNFPMQSGIAECLRLSICLGVENGIKICGSAHDAILIEAPLDRLDSDIMRMRGYMEQASEIVLNGFKLRTEFTAVRYPDRYMDERGRQFWDVVMSLL